MILFYYKIVLFIDLEEANADVIVKVDEETEYGWLGPTLGAPDW